MIKNIIFDNGGVIVKYSSKTYLDYFNFDNDIRNRLNGIFKSLEWNKFAKGVITSKEFLDSSIRLLPDLREKVMQVLNPDNLKYLLPVYKETVEFIKELKSKGYRVYLLSDINEDTISYMKEAVEGFESLFDGLVYSCRVGMVKKDGMVFDYMLKEYGLDASETLFLDDSNTNLLEANKRNINTYRFLEPKKDIDYIKNKILNVDR